MSDETRALAQAIAAGVNGTVCELACGGERSAHVVKLVDGRVPLLVQATPKHLAVTLGSRGWHQVTGAPDTTLVRDVVVATEKWEKSKPTNKVTMFELAFDITAALTAAFGAQWIARIDGMFERPRFELSGPNENAAMVRINEEGLVANDSIPVTKREQLEGARALVIEHVRAQHARYAHALELRTQMMIVANALAERLPWRARVTCTLRAPTNPVTHGWVGVATLLCKDARGTTEVDVRGEDDHVRVQAGLAAPRGWRGDVDVLDDAALASIAAAVETALATLTLDKLTVGAKYRVRETIDELKAGEIVTFKQFDDVDNHYGCYEFIDASGKTVGVGGDYSTPQNSTLGGDTGRYLEALS
jgi:hypothetical protein